MAKSRSFAQDVTQEVFLNVLENASRFDSAKGSVRAWLFGCARYVTLDRLRVERRWTDDMPADGAALDGDERLFTDPRFGDPTFELVNVVLGEPSPHLFQVSQGYEMAVDEDARSVDLSAALAGLDGDE
jgi:DNA-directed RNA polymerase specialized sigma24 family protein